MSINKYSFSSALLQIAQMKSSFPPALAIVPRRYPHGRNHEDDYE